MAPLYKVNIPIGHAGVPFYSNSQSPDNQRSLIDKDSISSILPFVSSSINSDTFGDKDYNYHPSIGTYNQYSSVRNNSIDSLEPLSFFDRLPFEIKLKIANELNQYDALNLMKVNKSFFQPAVVRLYHTIVIDPCYSQFNQEIYQAELQEHDQSVNSSTFIKMKYSLKNFLKIISQEIPIEMCKIGYYNSHYGSLINKIQFVELPDGFNSPFDLNFFTFMSVKRLERLSRFYWSSDEELSFEIVNRLPNKSNLNSLHVSVDFKKVRAGSTEFEAFRGFNNLEKLSLEPFLNSFNLFQIFKNLLEGNNDKLNLKVLRLARVNSNHNFIKNPSSSLLVLTSYIIENEPIKLSEYDMNCILNLFILFSAAETRLEDLNVLSLDSIVVSTMDARRLDSVMSLENLKQLELKNITEVQLPEDVHSPLSMNDLYARLDAGFLKHLGKNLKNLTKLSIDYRESLRDTVPAFIYNLENLQELDITIRWNVTKLCSIQSWKHLCFMYIKAILKHSKTLKKLSLDTKEDSVFCDLHKLIFTECLLELGGLTELESLRLHGYSLQPCGPLLASMLKKLKYFELFGSGAGGAPHMGLQVVHDGVLDDWFRVQHVAVAISEQNEHIEFIKIDKCLFEVQKTGKLLPRDGLEGWFESKVRVILNRVDF